ncbi:S8 family serine peptidase [Chryseolinea lacunae]|uniref:S8 family serine peptidase n=1 Tax=Chryseolinea lacunae TaxID=2801331 RepID=A0ABS1KWY9_9BACT|nr:S8 family serine peptidase [Chryseolinea lacunae]MBL0743988.1 S8 family serine peptidase [Chryseolinea lacunae]
MIDYLRTLKRRILLLGMLLCCAATGWAQEYQQSVRKGMVKVKVSAEMASTLSQARVRPGKELSTGIQPLDAVAKRTGAKNMYRLFPFNPKIEAKLHKHGLDLWYVVELDENTDPNDAVAAYKKVSGVTLAETDHLKIVSPFKVQEFKGNPVSPMGGTMPFNDPMLPSQWHYNNTGQSGYTPGSDINLFEAWKITAGKRGVIVSIHDEGVDVAHNDLAANIWTNEAELNGKPKVDDDNNGYVDDIHGWNFDNNNGQIDPQFHGTHVAGTIAAVNNNGIAVSGVAGGTGKNDGVQVMSMQTLGGGSFENSYVYAASNGAVISQNSWGYTNPGSFDQSVLDAIDYFIAEAGNYSGSPMRGGLVIFASGNSNTDEPFYPAFHPSVVAVNSIGPDYKRAYYSNYGVWTDITSTGGNTDLGGTSGVLSTLPNNKVGYMQGTSMACPHVSGIAALALSNRTHQMTADELRNQIVTGVRDIEEYNPDFVGLLGSGLTDAKLAIQNDGKIAPATIGDLKITALAQELATLTWTVPADGDDGRAIRFELYYSTTPLTAANLSQAEKIAVGTKLGAGETVSLEVNELSSLTTYYFGVVAFDRWGNGSVLSNIAQGTTNDGPTIAVDDASKNISLSIDASNTNTAEHTINLLNQGEGLLRWTGFSRSKEHNTTFLATGLNYPVASKVKTASVATLTKREANTAASNKNKISTLSFGGEQIGYGWDWPITLIGEMDTTIANSSATRFEVTEDAGFNLTHVQMWLRQNPKKGPIIVEVYKETLQKKNLIGAQEYNVPPSPWDENQSIQLDEQLFFEKGEVFWIVFHVPAGNLYPLGVAEAMDEAYSENCMISFDLGATWALLPEVIHDSRYVWSTIATSYSQDLGKYLTLTPSEGELSGQSDADVLLTADAAQLLNGNYSANIILKSNDSKTRELRLPVELTVTGQRPVLQSADVVDFGSVFNGKSKEMTVTVTNNGYGHFESPVTTLSNAQFEIIGGEPWQIGARDKVDMVVRFTPSGMGNVNATLTLQSGDLTHTIALFGVGTEASKIKITPATQTIDNLAIGDVAKATVKVENAGAFPLKYFVPGHDAKGISEGWPDKFHTYGYTAHNSVNDANPVAYVWSDIAKTGTDISDYFKNTEHHYYEVGLDFDFPFYAEKANKIYVTQIGMITLDNTVRVVNTPRLRDSYGPIAQIAAAGLHFKYLNSGKVFILKEADRFIVQYDHVQEGEAWQPLTFQIVLYDNGDIRFYYKNVSDDADYMRPTTALIEDRAKEDGILLADYETNFPWQNEMAFGFDYPGPDIITSFTNGSGLVMPGESADVELTLNTETLNEGATNKYVTFISNDPFTPAASANIKLNVTSGGEANAVVSTDAIAFGEVFKGAIKSQLFVIKNEGSASIDVVSVTLQKGKFALSGEPAVTLTAKHAATYRVTIPTEDLGALTDKVLIVYGDGTKAEIALSGDVVPAPAIAVDLSPVEETLEHGAQKTIPFVIKNTGAATLELAVSGSEWATTDVATKEVSTNGVPDIAYTWRSSKGADGPSYQWVDAFKTGTRVAIEEMDPFEDDKFWKKIDLEWPFTFYGKEYSALYVGYNGIITFDEGAPASLFTQNIPTTDAPNNFIASMWVPGGFDSYFNPDISGIFYKIEEDRIIISFERQVNLFSMGDPVSTQIILFRNGNIKFQYRNDGMGELVTQFGVAGIENASGTDGVELSAYQNLEVGTGLAYVLSPAVKRTLAAGESLNATLTLDAKNLFAGNYKTFVHLNTNVPNKESLDKPVTLTVTGEEKLVSDDAIAFGEVMAYTATYEDGSTGPKGYQKQFTLTNGGTATLTMTALKMESEDGTAALEVLINGFWGPEWTPVEWLEKLPTILPGESLQARVDIAPDGETAALADNVVIETEVTTYKIPVTATIILPPVLNVDRTPVKVSFNLPSEAAQRDVKLGNPAGKSDLKYDLSIRYKRAAAVASATNTESMALAKTAVLGTAAKTTSTLDVKPLGDETFNRVLQYEDSEKAESFLGYSGAEEFVSGTQFNGGDKGFNLTHVQTNFRSETLATGSIEVEIRAGGTNIVNAISLGKTIANYTTTVPDNGHWLTIALDKPAKILPHEDFYVILTYPMVIEFVQGFMKNSEVVENRYMFYSGGMWSDLQTYPYADFHDFGWMVRAAEETFEESAWVYIENETSGTVTTDAEHAVNLKFVGSLSGEGDQKADLVVKSNDPYKESVVVPLHMHVNQAPLFSGVPVAPRVVAEAETLDLNVTVTDPETNVFTVTATATYPRLTFALNGNTLTLHYAPDYTDAGLHAFVFEAKDEFGATRQVTVNIEVDNTNRAPKFKGTTRTLTYTGKGAFDEQKLATFFADPDNDALTFTATSSEETVAEVFTSGESFVVKPLTPGQTKVAFVVTDSYGAVLKDTLTVRVDNILGLEEAANQGLKVYPNPASHTTRVLATGDWRGTLTLELTDVSGKRCILQQAEATSEGVLLDVASLQRGFYLLRVTSKDKRATVKLIKD